MKMIIYNIMLLVFPLRMVFKKFLIYLKNGTFHMCGSNDCLSNDKTQINTFKIYNKKNILKKIIYKIIQLKKVKVKNNHAKFEGDSLLITSSLNNVKIFDKHNKKTLSIYFEEANYKKIMNNMILADKIFKIPKIIEFKDEEKSILEEYINDDGITEQVFYKIIDFYIFNQWDIKLIDILPEECDDLLKKEKYKIYDNLLEKKMILCHGDLWSSNILCEDSNIFFVDFENIDYYPIYYDLFYFMFSEAYIKNNYKYIENYLKGIYNQKFKLYFEKFEIEYNDNYKLEYLYQFLRCYAKNKWNKLSSRNLKREIKKLDNFMNRLERGYNYEIL